MSVNSLFTNNDFHLYCDTLICKNLVPEQVISTKAIYRFNVDPTLNPDPFTSGLIVTSVDTSLFDYVVPLTLNQNNLLLGNPFSYDPLNHLSLNNNTITCNKDGDYSISIQLNILTNTITPNNSVIAQILLPIQTMFSGPPGLSVGDNFANILNTPVGAIFDSGALMSASTIIHLNQGDQFNLKFYVSYDSCVIALTSCVSINEL